MSSVSLGITQEAKDMLTALKGEYMSYTDVIKLLVKEQDELSALKASNLYERLLQRAL